MKAIDRKLIVVGDTNTHKTQLLNNFCLQRLRQSQQYIFTNSTISLQHNTQTVHLQLCDTSGQQNFEQLRTLTYVSADIILITFMKDNQTSFINAINKWFIEVRKGAPTAIIEFVGIKHEDNDNPQMLSPLLKKTPIEGLQNCEVSWYNIKTGQGLQPIFQSVIHKSIQQRSQYSCCYSNRRSRDEFPVQCQLI